ncbi:MAG: GtrA family protein [Lachnospiraceae bacterium]|nr:GtrA family protein [Lachnospiraceae bacterium]
MIAKIKELFFKYEEIIVYLIVGGITTVVAWFFMFLVNIVIFGNPLHPTAGQNLVLSTVNWVAGTAVAYPMNRKLVFKSKDPNILAEGGKFLMGRISTYVMEVILRQILGLLGVNMYINTVVCAVMVIVGNYIFSKLLVFRKK